MSLPKKRPSGFTSSRRLEDAQDLPDGADFSHLVQRTRMQGGRILTTEGRDTIHLVSPGGRRWASYNTASGNVMGGDLSPITGRANEDLYDITEEFNGKK